VIDSNKIAESNTEFAKDSVSISETEMMVLLRLARELSGPVSLKELSIVTACKCQKLFHFDAFSLLALDLERQEQREIYSEDVMVEGAVPCSTPITDHPLPLSGNGVKILVERPVLFNRGKEEVPATTRFGNVKRASKSLMYCPITWHGKPIGNITVQSYTPQFFSNRELELLSVLASQLGGPMWRLRTEQALVEAEDRLGQLVENSNDFLALFSLDSRCLYFKASKNLVPLTRTMVGKYPEEIFNDGLARKFRRGIGEVVESGAQSSAEVEIPFEENKYWFNTRLYPVNNEQGGLSGIGLIACDVTTLRRTEEERWRLNEKVLEAQKLESLAALAGGIAQDLGNMIFGIESCAKLASEEHSNLSEGQVRALHHVVQTTEKANKLVGQLNSYAGSGEKKEHIVCFAKMIRGIEHLMFSLKGPSIEIYFDLDHGEACVEADRNEVEQIMMDLLQNAAEAIPTDQSGTVTIGCGIRELRDEWFENAIHHDPLEPGEYALFWVRDDGVGMGVDEIEKAFDPFYTRKEVGRGLGLSVCLGVIRSHHGAIRISSSKGEGTLIEVAFPLVRDGQMASKEVDLSAETTVPQTGRILLIEGEESSRFAMEAILKRNHYSVYTVSNGMEAMGVFDRMGDRLDLVLLDINIGGVPCDRLVRHFISGRGHLPLILTNPCRKADLPSNVDHKKIIQMKKPFPLRTLISQINYLLS
jgi:two-component system, cell cycle sensor histidine kinase and response regulator CckA